MILELDTASGSIAAYSRTSDDEAAFYAAIDCYCHLDEDLVNDLLLYLEDRSECPGFLASIRVSSNARGEGFGANLMGVFQQCVSNHTDVDFLVAHTHNPQEKGFDLLRFYRKYGFEPVIHQGDMVIMANKGWAKELRREVFPRLVKQQKQSLPGLSLR